MHLFSLLASSDDSGGAGGLVSLGVLLLIPAAMYFLMIRPQRRRMREQQSLQKSLGVGDEVITTSGIYGFITGEDGDKFWLEIDDDVQIRIARAAVQSKVNETAGSTSTDAASTDAASTDAASTGVTEADADAASDSA
jgi:preprotein translocase subunit YajC